MDSDVEGLIKALAADTNPSPSVPCETCGVLVNRHAISLHQKVAACSHQLPRPSFAVTARRGVGMGVSDVGWNPKEIVCVIRRGRC